MLNPHQVLYPLVRKNLLIVLDLKKGSKEEFGFNYFIEGNSKSFSSINFFIFSDTNLIGLIEEV